MSLMARHLNAERASLFLVDEVNAEIYSRYAEGAHHDIKIPLREDTKSIAVQVIAHRSGL